MAACLSALRDPFYSEMVGIRLLTLIPTLRYSNPPSCLPSRIEESFFSANFHLDLFFFVIRIERRDRKDRSKNIGRRRQPLDLLTLQVSREFRKNSSRLSRDFNGKR